MHASIERLLNVQAVDSEIIFLSESLRLRPRELDDDRRKLAARQKAVEALGAEAKQLRIESDRREVDVKKADSEVEKLRIALNQAKSNQEYTVIKEQLKRQEDLRGEAEEEVIAKLTEIDRVEADRGEAMGLLSAEEQNLKKKTAELEEVLEGMRGQLAALEKRRMELLDGIDNDHLRIYERVLARHNNFAIARVEDHVCQGCFISVTSQEVNLLMQEQFIQCKNCSRLLYLA